MGVQGYKRKKYLNKNTVITVDINKKADFKKIENVPLKEYKNAYVCVPDEKKINIIKFLVKNKKNVLVEKPLISEDIQELKNLEKLAKKKKTFLYTAYNHRFEQSVKKLKDIVKKKQLGKIYRCRIFYGNGTSILVKNSPWRDKGAGVLKDIGSHVFDLCLFIFGEGKVKIQYQKMIKFENKAPDHALIFLNYGNINLELEISLCMWKNSFALDLIGSNGSCHINSLCKWSESSLTFYKRVKPSGIPKEKVIKYPKGDVTWKAEKIFFENQIKKNTKTNLKNDFLINQFFQKIKN